MTIQASDVGQLAAGAVTDIIDRATSGTNVTEYAESTPLSWSVIEDGGWDLIGVPESADGGGGSLRDLVEVALAWGQGCMPLPFLESTWAKRWSSAARAHSGPVSVSVRRSPASVWAIPSQGTGTDPASTTSTVDGVPLAAIPPRDDTAAHGFADLPGLAAYGAFPGVLLARSVGRDEDLLEVAPVDARDPFAPSLHASLVRWTSDIPSQAALELGVVWAAEAAGAAQRLLDRSVAYAKTREQFGKPIGSFQAVKHRLADMHSEVQYAESAVVWASLEPENARRAATYALDTAIEVAEASIQVHGGMGFTWEMGLHFYLRTMLVRRQLVHGLWA